MEKLRLKLRRLRLGKSFNVSGVNQRQAALQIANSIGIRIHTFKRKTGGFTVTRLPE